MSRHIVQILNNNVVTFYLEELEKEERNVMNAEQEVIRLTAELNRCKSEVKRFRDALEILGVKFDNSKN